MKNLSFTLLLISFVSYCQIEREVGDFTKVTSFDRIKVGLLLSDENKVIIEGHYASDVELINNNGELKIRMPLSKIFDGNNVTATIYFKQIYEVEANEGSTITCNDTLSAASFSIIAKEGSEVKLFINAEKLSVKSTNGSRVILTGSTNVQEVVISTGGIYEAEKLETAITTVSCNAGGKATVNAADLVDAKVRAGGNIIIFGNPKQIKEKIIAGGSIKQAN